MGWYITIVGQKDRYYLPQQEKRVNTLINALMKANVKFAIERK